MPQSLGEFFGTHGFMPHGHCYLWTPSLVWLQVLSNGSIAAAYISIFATLVYLIGRIRDIPFQRMYVAFAVFIVACGVTHILDVYVIWDPIYWVDGSVRLVTAVASVGTAVLLPPLVPKAVALAEAAAVSHQRGIKLEEANKNLASLLDRTKELEQLKTQFFANVSHELRTPLTLILGPTERLLTSPHLEGDARRDLELVARNARTLLKHVNDLLDVAKLEAGQVGPTYAEVDFAELVRLSAANFDGLARERNVRYVVEAPRRIVAQVDPDKIERVLLNLLSNAFKFTPVGGTIRVALLQGGDDVRVEVADTGPGIDPEHRTLIFERFRQVEGGMSRRFGGTGLGLAIARDFAEIHGGTLGVDAAREGGALFTLTLPRLAPSSAKVQEARDATSEETRHALAQSLEELRGKVDAFATPGDDERPLVVVVEDNPEMSRFVAETLSRQYRTVIAANGRDGLEKLKGSRPDLVVTDLMMPEMSGDELVRAVRESRAFDSLPILVLTAKADDELRVRLLRQGAQDYLMKPFSSEELLARASNLVTMKRARDVLQNELEIQTKDLEVLAREVTSRGRELATALDSMKVARDQAQRASQLKSSFLGMVSHEFRTPVTALQLQLQLERLRRDSEAGLTESQRTLFQRMTSSTGRLAGLIESLLQHAQIESGRLDLQVAPFNVDELVSETVEEARPRAESKGLTLLKGSDSELPSLESDARLVRLIVVNLIENAVKFTRKGTVEVTVSHDRQKAAHRVSVRDTGPGIAPEAQAQVFEPFAQLESVREKHLPGIGLGLALVKEMAEALGGRIDLASSVGVGSTFTVELPSEFRRTD